MAGKTDPYGEEVSGPALYTMSGLYAQVPSSGPNDSQDNNSDVFPEKLPQVKTTEKQEKAESKSHRRQWSTTSSIVAVVTNNLMTSGSHGSDVVVRDCGLGNWRPTFLQKFASVETFVFLISSLVILQQTVCSGYINSVITTVEKRFEIPSSMMGLISSMYEIGNLVTVIFVSYLGSRRHIPFWIGVGAVIMGIGSFIFVLPYFLTDSRHLNDPNSLTNNTQENICKVTIRESDQDEMGLGRLSEGLSAPPLAPHNNIPGRRDNCLEMTSDTALPVFIFMMGQLLLGCGGSPIFTLGTTYIDDHVRKEDSAVYIGIMYSTVAFGPVCGFLLGAYLLSYNVDIFVASPSSDIHHMEQKDPRWIGLWWGGFLICGILFLIVSAPFFTFPKSLERVKEKLKMEEKSKGQKRCRSRRESSVHSNNCHSGGDNHSYGKDIKDIPDSMWRLLCNPIYVVTCLGACMELIIVSGFIVFLPKYLETQFSVSKSQASVFTGGIAIPGACIGIIMGGCMLKRFQLRPGGAVKLVLALNFFCLSLYGFLFFLGCPNVKMAGTTQPYFNSTPQERSQFEVNLTASCNFGCQCSPNEVDPVCGSNGLTYFSPCHAGCTSLASKYNYTNCACIKLSGPASVTKVFSDVTATPLAVNGPCVAQCDTILLFMILLFFMTLVVAVTQMPLLMIVLRSVEEEERSFALGMQFVIFRLFGYIPSPILFGNAIDSTCLLWKEGECGIKSGRCLMYDIEAFHFKYIGIGAGIKIIAAAIFMFDLFLIKRMYKIDMGTLTVGEIVNSVVSIDKVHEDCAGECHSLSDAGNWDANLTDDEAPNSKIGTPEST